MDGVNRGLLRLSRSQNLEKISPPLFRTSQFQEPGEPFPLLAVEFQRVHTCRVQAILGSSQKSGLSERLNGLGDLLHVISHKNRELLAGQE